MDADDSHVHFLSKFYFLALSSGLLDYLIFLYEILQVVKTLLPDPMKQEPLLVENIPDPLEGEQVTLQITFVISYLYII